MGILYFSKTGYVMGFVKEKIYFAGKQTEFGEKTTFFK